MAIKPGDLEDSPPSGLGDVEICHPMAIRPGDIIPRDAGWAGSA
jgi:hypothetical protein